MSSVQTAASSAKEGFKRVARKQIPRGPAYVKGRSGFADGFLPPRSTPVPFTKSKGTMEQTVRKSVKTPKVRREELPEVAQWKQKTSDLRRDYMTTHLTRQAENAKKHQKISAERQQAGFLARQEALHAPENELERLALPSIEASIADEYPLQDPNKAEREARRTENRRQREADKEESRLHQFLTIHHNSSRYVTTLEGLDELLERRIGAAQYFDTVPKYKLNELVGQPGSGSYSFGKINQLEAAIEDQIIGTAAGGKPGVVEVGHILKHGISEEQSQQEEAAQTP